MASEMQSVLDSLKHEISEYENDASCRYKMHTDGKESWLVVMRVKKEDEINKECEKCGKFCHTAGAVELVKCINAKNPKVTRETIPTSWITSHVCL